MFFFRSESADPKQVGKEINSKYPPNQNSFSRCGKQRIADTFYDWKINMGRPPTIKVSMIQ